MSLGLTREDVAATEVVDIWPDNFESVCLFTDLLTQWRVGVNGLTGLDYTAVVSLFHLRRVRGERRAEIFDDLRVMEAAVLNKVRTKK